jgi:hypothetical protein
MALAIFPPHGKFAETFHPFLVRSIQFLLLLRSSSMVYQVLPATAIGPLTLHYIFWSKHRYIVQ